MSLSDLRRHVARLRRLRVDRSDVRPKSAYRWYDSTCRHDLPPGQCREHPRARPSQRPPAGDWRTWLILAGRGWGKTRTGIEWVRREVESGRARRVALVAATAADCRDVLIEGESGLLACSPPWFRPLYEPSKRRITWPNGAIGTTYSAEEPERLRGPQHDLALCDEVAVWEKPGTWSNLRLGLRLGTNPRVCVMTTPRPTDLLKSILAEPSTVKASGSTYENRAQLAADFMEMIVSKFEGTRLGRQEIYAELLEVLDGAWWPQFDPARHVTAAADYRPGLPVYLAIDCGVSGHTGAVFFQVQERDAWRYRVNVFGDYYAFGLYSEANALAIRALAPGLCRNVVDYVRLDPAASAHTGIGPAAYGEYERVFGARRVGYWPTHLVADGLDQIELLLGTPGREPDLIVHPRAKHLISAFNTYVHAERAGVWIAKPKDPNHPAEDLMDALRGGIREARPEGSKPQPHWNRVPARRVLP